MLQIGRSLDLSRLVSLEFFIDIKSFRSHYGSGVDSASNRNYYREYFLGVKSGRCVRLTTLPPFCAVVMKSGNLNFLEPSGPLQVCNETASPFILRCMGANCSLRISERNMHSNLFRQSAQDSSMLGRSADESPVNFSCTAERGLGSSDAQVAYYEGE